MAEIHVYEVRDASGAVLAVFDDIGDAVEFRNVTVLPGEWFTVVPVRGAVRPL